MKLSLSTKVIGKIEIY